MNIRQNKIVPLLCSTYLSLLLLLVLVRFMAEHGQLALQRVDCVLHLHHDDRVVVQLVLVLLLLSLKLRLAAGKEKEEWC